MPVLRLDGRRFAVRADAVGRRLAFAEIVGVGRLTLELPALAKAARVQQLQVMLVGEDGSAFSVQGLGEPASIPVGRYAVESVGVVALDGKRPEPWHFDFSRSGEPAQRWYEVRADAETRVDPVGTLRFDLALALARAAEPGKELSVTPRLFTGDGLLINSSVCGDVDRYASADKHNCATVELVTSSGKTLAAARSGFA
jgi:hypothetical protein